MDTGGFMGMNPDTLITLVVIVSLWVIVLALIFNHLRVNGEKGDLKVSLDGSKSADALPASTPRTEIETQNVVSGDRTDVEGGQHSADRDITNADGDID